MPSNIDAAGATLFSKVAGCFEAIAGGDLALAIQGTQAIEVAATNLLVELLAEAATTGLSWQEIGEPVGTDSVETYLALGGFCRGPQPPAGFH